MERLKARVLACIHHLSIGRLGAGTRTSAVVSGSVLSFAREYTLARAVLFSLGLGLKSRQKLNGPEVTNISVNQSL